MSYGPLLQVRTFGKPRLADVTRAELHADPRPGGFRRFRHRVLPGALTAAAHDQQIAVADVVTPRYRPAAHGPQQKRARGAQREDRDHGVLRAAPAHRVTVPGHAVPAGPVQADARPRERPPTPPPRPPLPRLPPPPHPPSRPPPAPPH